MAEWLSAPEFPVRVNVLLPTTALVPAVRLTLCGVPGVSVSVAGCAVTPAGSPAIATDTAPAKELVETAFTLICCPAPPDTTVRALGAAVKVKSPAGAATVSVTAIEWLSVPEVPKSVKVPLPTTALALALRLTVCAVPGVSVSVAGCAVTPAGPVIATDTVPAKPFDGAAVTLSDCPAPPAISIRLDGMADREKSAAGVVPDESPVATREPPPQDTSARQNRELKHHAKAFEETPMSRLRSSEKGTRRFPVNAFSLQLTLNDRSFAMGCVK